MKDNFSELIKAAAGFDESAADGLPPVSANLERRVMMEVARRALERSRKRARRGMIASLSGLAMLLAGGIAALVVWFPALLPAFTRLSWLKGLRIPKLEGTIFDAATGAVESAAALPLFEQWGGLILILLLIGGAAGFVYYLNSLFSSDYPSE